MAHHYLYVPIINESKNPLPQYQTEASSGMDLFAAHGSHLQPMERGLIRTGISLAIPRGYEAQIRSRSGLALKEGVIVLNAPGTIDADYRGEIGVILINLSSGAIRINKGERIAQLVFAPVTSVVWDEDQILEETDRGTGGFGSTGS